MSSHDANSVSSPDANSCPPLTLTVCPVLPVSAGVGGGRWRRQLLAVSAGVAAGRWRARRSPATPRGAHATPGASASGPTAPRSHRRQEMTQGGTQVPLVLPVAGGAESARAVRSRASLGLVCTNQLRTVAICLCVGGEGAASFLRCSVCVYVTAGARVVRGAAVSCLCVPVYASAAWVRDCLRVRRGRVSNQYKYFCDGRRPATAVPGPAAFWPGHRGAETLPSAGHQ